MKRLFLVMAVLAIMCLGGMAQAFDVYQGHSYFLTDVLNWTDAEAVAQFAGGDLVTVNDAPEYAWLQNTFGTSDSFWIGFYRPTQNDPDYVWVSGQTTPYTNWVEQEPTRGDEQYTAMNQHPPRGWNDLDASWTMRGIVEVAPVPEPATLLGFGLPMLMVGIGKLRSLRK